MSEETPTYSHPKGELRFVRLKNTFEDLVGYVMSKDGYLTIYQPLKVEIETLFNEGRQILSMQEYLPQSIIDIREINILSSDVMFIAPVKWDFYDQYKQVSDFFYGNDYLIKEKTTKHGKQKTKPKVNEENQQEQQENVISLLDALAKKEKGPVH
jgi:hypothetical protein